MFQKGMDYETAVNFLKSKRENTEITVEYEAELRRIYSNFSSADKSQVRLDLQKN